MRHHRLTTSHTICRERESRPAPVSDLIEAAQLRRLAGAVLSKSPDDLAALAETNPLLVWEWIDAFRKERLAAEAEARYWSAAAAALSTATPEAVRAAAE
jgi:hypothetical protein